MPPAKDCCCHWRGITRYFLDAAPMVRGFGAPTDGGNIVPVIFADVFPQSPPRSRVKSNHPGIRLAAHHHDQPLTFQERRAAHAKKWFRHIPVFGGVALPDQLARGQLQTQEFAFRSERIATIGAQQGSSARPIIVTEGVLEMARVSIAPQRSAGGGCETLDEFFVVKAMV